jgi:hypothetical protein
MFSCTTLRGVGFLLGVFPPSHLAVSGSRRPISGIKWAVSLGWNLSPTFIAGPEVECWSERRSQFFGACKGVVRDGIIILTCNYRLEWNYVVQLCFLISTLCLSLLNPIARSIRQGSYILYLGQFWPDETIARDKVLFSSECFLHAGSMVGPSHVDGTIHSDIC